MNIYTYDFELQTMTTMLLNCFSDIIIKRFNVHKQPRDQIKTRVVYAPKQRILLDLLDKEQNIQLPVISVYIGGIARDEARVFNKLVGSFHNLPNSTSSYNEKGPQPIDVTYNVSIMTRYQQDMDQILSHLLPYVNPYFVVSWRTPNRPDYEIRSNVYWSGNVNIQYPTDVNATQVARVVADLTFTFKGWLFQVAQEVENIYKFDMSLVDPALGIKPDGSIPEVYALDRVQPFEYEALPKPRVVEPSIVRVGNKQEFQLWGSGFEKTKNVYLSGVPFKSKSFIHDPFNQNPKLSALNPPFFATKLLSTDWALVENDSMTFVMPSANKLGFVDIIIENPAGYGKLTNNVRINTFNPFVSSDPEYFTYILPQAPFLSGIEVIPPTTTIGIWDYEHNGYWSDLPVLSAGVKLYQSFYTNAVAANLSGILLPGTNYFSELSGVTLSGDYIGNTNASGILTYYRWYHPNSIDLGVPFYYNGVLTNETILYYNGTLTSGSTVMYTSNLADPRQISFDAFAGNLSGTFDFGDGYETQWFTNSYGLITWETGI